MDQPNLSMIHHRWIVVIKDYDYKILCTPRKANFVVDVLSCKSDGSSVGSLCMKILIDSPLLDFIKEA